MARIYATPADLGATVPDDAEDLLARATRLLESRVLRYCWYNVDSDGMPTSQVVTDAIRGAVVAQVLWWDELGDSTGAAGAGWGSVSIGSVQLARSVTNVSPEASPARQLAPEAADALQSPDLTPDIFRLGEVTTW